MSEIIPRRPLPNVGETAREARKRSCGSVPDWLSDNDYVVSIDDRAPREWAWSITWASGVTSGVRSGP